MSQRSDEAWFRGTAERKLSSSNTTKILQTCSGTPYTPALLESMLSVRRIQIGGNKNETHNHSFKSGPSRSARFGALRQRRRHPDSDSKRLRFGLRVCVHEKPKQTH